MAQVQFLTGELNFCKPHDMAKKKFLLKIILLLYMVTLVVKNLRASAGNMRHGFYLWVGKILWRRAWQCTPVFLPGESPWTEKPGGVQSIGLQRVGHD